MKHTMKLFTSIWILFTSCIICNVSQNPNHKLALSHITLLLPYSSHYEHSPAQFKITAHGGPSNGCIQWNVVPEKHVIDIIPIQSITQHHRDECPPNTFNAAIIKAVSPPQNGRTSATIIATVPKTGQSAECEVFIDKIHRLQVATSTRLIYLGKYESIAVNGFDDKGNKFTTLQGIAMKWSGIKTHLQIISFAEARLMLPGIMDGTNKNPLPVKGITTGQEDVKVEIDTRKHPSHKGCTPAAASLFVVMQLQLVPRTLYAAKCCSASFDLITTSHSELDLTNGNIKFNESYHLYTSDTLKKQKIHIPMQQYHFTLNTYQASKSLKMSIQQDGTLHTTHSIEYGKLLVEDMVADKSADAYAVENTADAGVYVVDAYSIKAQVVKNKRYTIRPNTYTPRTDDWYLTNNEEYLFRLTLYDKHDNAMCVRQLYPSEITHVKDTQLMSLKAWQQEYICDDIEWNVNVLDYDTQVIAQIQTTSIDNQFKITPIKTGSFTLKFTAKGTHCAHDEILARSTKKVMVTSRVSFQNTSTVFCPHSELKLKQQLILIPFSGTHNSHKVPVFFEGGSGRYRLEMNNTNIATLLKHDLRIGQDDKLTVIQGNAIGNAYLFVIDYFNPDNYAFIKVEVEWIHTWLLDQYVHKEILINDYIEIPLMIRDRYNRRFSALDGLQQVITTSSRQQLVSLEFRAPTIGELISSHSARHKKTGNTSGGDVNNTQIIKNIKRTVLNTLDKEKEEPQPIYCDEFDAKVHVGGVASGYDTFMITLSNHKDVHMNTTMFVSVYKEIKPQHKAVAIAINIHEPYTMHWNYGPNPWPIKDILPVDDQFIHPLQVHIPPNNAGDSGKDKKDFSYRYNGKTLEFICYREFHSFVQLSVHNRVSDSLPFPVRSSVDIEIFCFPQFTFAERKMEMGVGTRKSAKTLYPQWVQGGDDASFEFFIEIGQMSGAADVVSVVNNNHLVAKRLGSSLITGKLSDPTQRVHIHPNGFNDSCEVIVLFKGFTMEMASYWIIDGNNQMAHIEGLDNDHHILPFRHNFDDVSVEWQTEDANIVELLPVIARPSDMNGIAHKKKGNVGNGLSVQLGARSVGLVNIVAVIKLRNAPKQIKKTEFQLRQTVTVIPRVVYPCNSIILKPNSSLSLSAQFNPDTNVAGIGQIYNLKHHYSSPDTRDNSVHVQNKKLIVTSNAPPAENVVVTLVLQSPNYAKPHHVKQYPLAQSASLIVSIVEPTGLNLLNAQTIGDNAIFARAVYNTGDDMNQMDSNSPFWSSLSSSLSSNDASAADIEYSATENIVCEGQNVTLQIAILDELGRELHVMDDVKVVSNDTTVVLPREEIKISTLDIGGAMYATVHLDAFQPGYATITFREKDVQSTSSSQHQYVYDDPTFLRTFLTIHVLSTAECEASFGVTFAHEEDEKEYKNDTTMSEFEDEKDYKNGKNWQPNTAKLPAKDSNVLAAIFGVVIFVCIAGCTWGSCGGLCAINGPNNDDDQLYPGALPPAAFNPTNPYVRSIQGAIGQRNSFNQSQSFGSGFNASGFTSGNSSWQM
eukprot:42851_1